MTAYDRTFGKNLSIFRVYLPSVLCIAPPAKPSTTIQRMTWSTGQHKFVGHPTPNRCRLLYPQPLHTILTPQQASTVNTSDVNSVHTRSHCDRTSTSHIGLVGHLRIHRTEAGEPVPGAPTYTRHIRHHSSHCSHTFSHRMGLPGNMGIYENGTDRSLDTPSTSCTFAMPSPTHTPSPNAPTTISPATTSTPCTPNMPSPKHPSPSASTINSSTTATIS
nr:unnamed protein product [Spirometra erinaceieuropaei]